MKRFTFFFFFTLNLALRRIERKEDGGNLSSRRSESGDGDFSGRKSVAGVIFRLARAGKDGGKYRLSEERRADGRQASKCSHRSQSPKCLHHRDGIRLLSAVSGRLEFVRESFE